MNVSIVIAAYNAERTIAECLTAIKNLVWDWEVEVIVVNDGSTDSTAEIASTFPEVQVVTVPNGGAPRAINTGIKTSHHDIVVTVDSDVVIEKEWLKKIIPSFKEPNVAAVGGAIVTGNRRLLGRIEGYYSELRWDKVPRYTDHLSGTALALRRQVFFEVGMFDEQMVGDGDSDLSRKLTAAGYRLVFEREAKCKHYWKDDLKSYFRQQFLCAYNRLLITRKFKRPEDQIARMSMIMQAPFTVLVLLAAALGSLVSPFALGVIILLPLIHIPDAIRIVYRKRDLGVLLLPLQFTLRNFIWLYAAMVWGFRELFKWRY